jgi:hypothetical protein
MSEKQSTEGKPMYVESLMTKDEWSRRMKAFPSTSHLKYDEANERATNSFKWRYGMGSGLSGEEIGIINRRLDAVLKKARG